MDTNTILFFEQQPEALALYEVFEKEVINRYPDIKIKVQKTQISFSNKHLFACASFLRLVITLGMPYPLDSTRVAVKTEPYPGRWTTHIVIGKQEDVDAELLGWLAEAYDFAAEK